MSIDTYREALMKLDELEEIVDSLQDNTRFFIVDELNKIKQIIEHDLENLELIKMSESFK